MELVKPKVCIGIPSGDHVHARFTTALIGMILASAPKVEIVYINYMSSRITQNRCEIVKFAQEQKASHVMFIACLEQGYCLRDRDEKGRGAWFPDWHSNRCKRHNDIQAAY